MKILDTPPAEVSPVQSIPSVGLLKSFAKPESKSAQSFVDLLHEKSNELSNSEKLTAGAALLARRAPAFDGQSGDRKINPSNVADETTATEEGVSGDSDKAVVAVSEAPADADAPLKQCDIPPGLDPSDLALEAAAIAAAALVAAASTETPQDAVSTDGASDIQQSSDSQVSIRFYQSSCRPSLTTVLSDSAVLSDSPQLGGPSSEVISAQSTGGAEIVPQAVGNPALASAKQTTTAGLELAAVSQIPKTVAVPEAVPAALRKDLTENTNLQLNQVVEAVAAYSRAAEMLAKPEAPGVIQEKLDAAPAVVPESPLEQEKGAAILVEQKVNDQTGDRTDSDDQSQNGDGSLRKDHAAAVIHEYTKMGKLAPSNASAPSKIVPDRALEPTPANIAKLYSEPVVGNETSGSVESSSFLASDDVARTGDVKIVGSDMSTAVLPGHEKVTTDVVSKPVVEAPRQVHNNTELWKAIGDAVQRVRSENPRHLAVELRMGDGSTVGLELRMGAAGVEAAFKSDSHGLLKALESQWAAFTERSASEPIKVTSTVFEGRTGLDYSGGGGDAQEKREAFEDSAAAAALAWQTENFSVELPAETTTNSASPKGLLNIYA
ncbi:MAG: hypothetical protein WCO60_12310 [Verrucomicrobiota bacterium]